MPDFAVLYSLRCRSLLVSHLVGWTQASHTDSSFLLAVRGPQTVAGDSAALLNVNNLSSWIQHCLTPPALERSRPQTSAIREARTRP